MGAEKSEIGPKQDPNPAGRTSPAAPHPPGAHHIMTFSLRACVAPSPWLGWLQPIWPLSWLVSAPFLQLSSTDVPFLNYLTNKLLGDIWYVHHNTLVCWKSKIWSRHSSHSEWPSCSSPLNTPCSPPLTSNLYLFFPVYLPCYIITLECRRTTSDTGVAAPGSRTGT